MLVCLFYISSGTNVNKTCSILGYDYVKLSSMNYEDALKYVNNQTKPEEISCLSGGDNKFHFDQKPGLSIVPEVSL